MSTPPLPPLPADYRFDPQVSQENDPLFADYTEGNKLKAKERIVYFMKAFDFDCRSVEDICAFVRSKLEIDFTSAVIQHDELRTLVAALWEHLNEQ